MAYLPFGAKTYNLASSISSTATSITLSSFQEPVTATPYTMVLIGSDIVYATIAPKTTSSEFISFTGITQNASGTATLTGVTRGLAKKTPFTTDSAYKLAHSGQTQFIISDAPQVFNEYVTLDNDETIVGLKTFPGGGTTNAPVSGTSYTAPTNNLEYSSKKYADDLAIAGSPDASTTVKGIVEEATQVEVDAKTAAGGTSARLFLNPTTQRSVLLSDYIADTGAADAYVIAPSPAITAYAAGQRFTFKATTANTTTSTVNVNALGVKTIKKLGNTTNLVANDILADQIIEVEYDGTYFQMLSPSGKDFVDIVTTQTVAGTKTFSGAALLFTGTAVQFTALPQSSATATATSDFTTKTYVDGVTSKISTVVTDVTVGNTTTETDIISVSIPAATLGTDNGVKARIYISDFDQRTDGDATCTLRFKYGSTTALTLAVLQSSTADSNLHGYIEVLLVADGATSAQEISASINLAVDSAAEFTNTAINQRIMSGDGTAAEDSTGALTFAVSVQWGDAETGNTTTMKHAIIEKVI